MGTTSTSSFRVDHSKQAGATIQNCNMLNVQHTGPTLYLHQSHIPKFILYATILGWKVIDRLKDDILRMRHPHYKTDLVVTTEIENKRHLVIGMSIPIYRRFLAKLKIKR